MKVRDVSVKFGITQNMIYPVQNYSSETEKELGVDLLALTILRQILRSSKEFLQDRLDRDTEIAKQAKRSIQEIEHRYNRSIGEDGHKI